VLVIVALHSIIIIYRIDSIFILFLSAVLSLLIILNEFHAHDLMGFSVLKYKIPRFKTFSLINNILFYQIKISQRNVK